MHNTFVIIGWTIPELYTTILTNGVTNSHFSGKHNLHENLNNLETFLDCIFSQTTSIQMALYRFIFPLHTDARTERLAHVCRNRRWTVV